MLKRLLINNNIHPYVIQRIHTMKCICSFLYSVLSEQYIYLSLYYKSNPPNDPHRDLVVSMEERGLRVDLNLYDKQSEHIYAEFECMK